MPHNTYHGGYLYPGANPAPLMAAAMAPVVMAPMGPMCIPQGAPPFWQPPAAQTTIAIVGDSVKEEDEWSQYEDDDGTPFYHNPARPDETTWEKPQDFESPPPPTKPKDKGPKYK